MSAPADEESRATPDLDGFLLLEELGRGSSAIVHRVLHTDSGHVVALKVWQRPLDPAERQRFLRECAVHRQLTTHPNIVDFLWAAAPEGRSAWIAMALCDESLAQRLQHAPRPTTEEALQLADDLLAGLAEIHRQGHLHRDVKPANVLLRGGQAMLADLGLARPVTEHSVYPSAGTGGYLAPELGRGQAADARTDVYAAAVVLFELFGDDLPGPVEALLTRASSIKPSDRPADAAVFLDRLQALRAGKPSTVSFPVSSEVSSPGAAGAPPPTTTAPPRRRAHGRPEPVGWWRRRRTALSLLAAVLLLGGGSLGAAVATGRLRLTGTVQEVFDRAPGSSGGERVAPGRSGTTLPAGSAVPTAVVSASPGPGRSVGPSGGVIPSGGPVATGPAPSGLPARPSTAPTTGTGAPAVPANVILRADFSTPQRGWPIGPSSAGDREWRSGRYDVRILAAGVADFVIAPASRPATDARVVATGRLTAGQGGWGVWCRGTSGGQRYEFSLTHAGNVYIKTPDGETAPVHVPVDAYSDNALTADCRDAPSGGGVQLSLRVNGALAASYLDRGPTLLPPGRVGLHAFSYSDVTGDLAAAAFRSFTLSSV